MSFYYIIRVILGVLFAFVGFQLATRFISLDPSTKNSVVVLIVLVSGAIGVFLGPIISVSIRSWTANFSRRVASEVITQLRLPRINTTRKPKSDKEKETYQNPIVVDTSALIDGRIADMAESGFMTGTMIVARFVLSELHHIADAPDALRRGKGRRGLEILERLKKSKWIKTVIYAGKIEEEKEIDNKLIVLAKIYKAKILTTDFNLNKVATVSGIKILNINELVNVLKTTLLPGEPLEVKIIQEGKEKTQGVGYLPDGTMIVVENGSGFVGKTIPTTVSRVLQTAAGRMIFVQTEGAARKQTADQKEAG